MKDCKCTISCLSTERNKFGVRCRRYFGETPTIEAVPPVPIVAPIDDGVVTHSSDNSYSGGGGEFGGAGASGSFDGGSCDSGGGDGGSCGGGGD